VTIAKQLMTNRMGITMATKSPLRQINQWSLVEIKLSDIHHLSAAFEHLCTSAETRSAPTHRRCGQTLWGTQCQGGVAGLAFEWTVLHNDVVALSDPMRIVSNIAFVEDDGGVIDERRRVVHLNSLVHSLDWQTEAHAARTPRRAAVVQPLAA
jgi:hypothetical protein